MLDEKLLNHQGEKQNKPRFSSHPFCMIYYLKCYVHEYCTSLNYENKIYLNRCICKRNRTSYVSLHSPRGLT